VGKDLKENPNGMGEKVILGFILVGEHNLSTWPTIPLSPQLPRTLDFSHVKGGEVGINC